MTDDRRVRNTITRGDPFIVTLDDEPLSAYPGESLAAAITANGTNAFRYDKNGAPRAPYCNMGVCFDCLLYVQHEDNWLRKRACMTRAEPNMIIKRVEPQ